MMKFLCQNIILSENESPCPCNAINNKTNIVVITPDDNGIGDEDEDKNIGLGDKNNPVEDSGGTAKKLHFNQLSQKSKKFQNKFYKSYEYGYYSDGEIIPIDEYADIWDDPDEFLDDANAEFTIEDYMVPPVVSK